MLCAGRLPDSFSQSQGGREVVALHGNLYGGSGRAAKLIAARNGFLSHKAASFKIKLKLTGIYCCKDILFYQFILQNKSQIDYDIDYSRFYIRNKRQVKRTAQQEQAVKPLYVYFSQGKTTSGGTTQTMVAAFKKFTIADHKDFVTQLFEKNGDRNLILKISGDALVKAKKIPVPAE